MTPGTCGECGGELTGKQVKFCSKNCRDLSYHKTTVASRPGNTGKCRRCDGPLKGRQRVWCSMACQRDHETELALVNDIETYVRKCASCGLQKPLAIDFYKTPGGTYRRQCRACIMEGNKVRTSKPDTADAKRQHHLVSLYGITRDEYELMLRAQGGRCAVCEKPPIKRRLAVDHSHVTGEVRGLLCNYCNLRIIAKHTDARLYRRAAEYLDRPPARDVIGARIVPTRPPKKRRPRKRRTTRSPAARVSL